MRRNLIVLPLLLSLAASSSASLNKWATPTQSGISQNGPVGAASFKIRSILSGPSVRLGYGWSAPMAFSPDGKTLALGSHGGSISLWDVSTGQLRATLKGHKRLIIDLIFSADGRLLASASADETVKLWSTETDNLVASFKGHKSWFLNLSLSADGKYLATASEEDKSPRVWDVHTNQLLRILPPAPDRDEVVSSLKFSPAEPILAATTFFSVYLWNPQTGTLRSSLVDESLTRPTTVVVNRHFEDRVETFSHASTIYQMAFSPDGRWLATGSRDRTAKLWDVATGMLAATLKHEGGNVVTLAFSPDSGTLATGSADATACLWKVKTGEKLAALQHRGTVWSLSFSPNGKLIASGSDNEKAVKVWDTVTGKLIATLTDSRYFVAFSPDGRTLATAKWGRPGTVFLWDVPPR